jgi:aspartate aminotransferase
MFKILQLVVLKLYFLLWEALWIDDEIIIPEPLCKLQRIFSTASGVKVVPVISTIETGFALPPIAGF